MGNIQMVQKVYSKSCSSPQIKLKLTRMKTKFVLTWPELEFIPVAVFVQLVVYHDVL